jgi:serine/threonine-protein kinase
MGVVYEATHARLAGRYAIKVLLRELSERPELRARFDREARITSLLQHPNVVQVIDHNSTADGTSYLVMEFLSGESLAARLSRAGRLSARAVVDIVDQIAAGLAAAHTRGIVHRDLKPDNVFLVPVEGRATDLVKILDFGISKVSWGRDAIDREICGTPQYMAPEQVEGRAGDVDFTTDQWALAVIAYELLTGQNPFAAESIPEIFERVRSGVVLPTGLGGGVDAVLGRALRQENALRFPSVTAFAEAFREAALPPSAEVAPLPLRTSLSISTSQQLPPAVTRRSRQSRGGLRLGFAAAAAIAMTSFLGTGAANRAPSPNPVVTVPRAPRAAIAVAPAATSSDESARPNVPEQIVATDADAAAPAPIAVRPAVRRARSVRGTALDDRPMLTIPTAARRREAPPVLAPDEDATLPPSAF